MVSEWKKSEVRLVPSEWELVKLTKIAERVIEKNKGKSGNVLTISAQHGLVSQLDFFNKNVASKNLDNYYYLRNGDFAYNKSYSTGYPMGAIKPLELYEHGVVSTLYICFRMTSTVSQEFYKYYFESDLWHTEVRNIAQEGGRSHGLLNISLGEFFNINLHCPPLQEQHKIADILSSVDKAITKTEAIIKQTERLKTGLMQDFLTKGIGHTKFKQTEIGEIPKEWEVVRVVDALLDYKSGASISPIDFIERGVKVLPKKAISELGTINISEHEYSYVSKEFAYKNLKATVSKEYLVTTLRDLVPAAPSLGRIVAINDDDNYLMAQGVYAFTINENILNRNFLIYLSNYSLFREQVLKRKVGSTQVHMRKNDYFDILIPLPGLEEQIKIISVLAPLDTKLLQEKQKLSQIQTLKKGLMQDLLTGKVRVKLDN